MTCNARDIDAFESALYRLIEEFTDAHSLPVCVVVGTLHMVAASVIEQNKEPEIDPELN